MTEIAVKEDFLVKIELGLINSITLGSYDIPKGPQVNCMYDRYFMSVTRKLPKGLISKKDLAEYDESMSTSVMPVEDADIILLGVPIPMDSVQKEKFEDFFSGIIISLVAAEKDIRFQAYLNFQEHDL